MSITFDGPAKRIRLGAGTVMLPVRELWSRYCDWLAEADNSKYLEAMRQVGGDIEAIPIYLFMLNGWRVVPQAADHTLEVNDGVLYVDGGGDPFVDPAGAYKIRIVYQSPGIAIGYSTSGASGPSAADIAAQVRAAIAADLERITQIQTKVDATL